MQSKKRRDIRWVANFGGIPFGLSASLTGFLNAHGYNWSYWWGWVGVLALLAVFVTNIVLRER